MRKSRLSWAAQSELIGQFIEGSSTRHAAEVAQVNKNTANTFFNRLRQLIYVKCSNPGFIQAEVGKYPDLLESALLWSKSENSARPFGLVLECNKVYVALLPGCHARLPDCHGVAGEMISIEPRVPNYLVFFNPRAERFCAGMMRVDDSSPFRVQACEHHLCPMKKQFGDDNFCNYFSRQQKKYFGVPEENFHLYLKECEWKFNNPDRHQQRMQLEEWAISELA